MYNLPEVVEDAGVGVASSLKEAVTGITPTVCETLVKAEVVVEAIEVTTFKSSDIDIKSPLDGPLVPVNKFFYFKIVEEKYG